MYLISDLGTKFLSSYHVPAAAKLPVQLLLNKRIHEIRYHVPAAAKLPVQLLLNKNLKIGEVQPNFSIKV